MPSSKEILAFVTACAQADIALIGEICSNIGFANIPIYKKTAVFRQACHHRNRTTIEELLKWDILAPSTTNPLWTAYVATSENDATTLKTIFEQKNLAEIPKEDISKLALLACQHDAIDCLEYLLVESGSLANIHEHHHFLHHACREGSLSVMDYLLVNHYEKFFSAQPSYQQVLDDALYQAILGKHHSLVLALLQSPKLSKHANIHAHQERALSTACYRGDLSMVKFLLTSQQLQDRPHLAHCNALSQACLGGHLEIVKYLLTSPELSQHADLRAGTALKCACEKNDITIIRYLLFSSELLEQQKTHATIELDNYLVFSLACRDGYLQQVKLFIPLVAAQDLPLLLEEGFLQAYAGLHSEVAQYILEHDACPITARMEQDVCDDDDMLNLMRVKKAKKNHADLQGMVPDNRKTIKKKKI